MKDKVVIVTDVTGMSLSGIITNCSCGIYFGSRKYRQHQNRMTSLGRIINVERSRIGPIGLQTKLATNLIVNALKPFVMGKPQSEDLKVYYNVHKMTMLAEDVLGDCVEDGM